MYKACVPGEMGRLLQLVENLQVQIDLLHRGHESIREENEALRACLESTGGLAREQFLAQVHRRRFAKVLRQHPYALEVHPAEVLQSPDLLQLTMRLAGAYVSQQCSAVSRALNQAAALLRPRLYTVGGSDGVAAASTVDRFDDQEARWEALPAMPTPRSHLVAVACAGQLFAIGGTDGERVLPTCEVFNWYNSEWKSLPPMPTARSGMAATASHGHLYVVGGREGFRSLGIVERFSVEDCSWSALPSMQSRRRFLAAAALGGNIYAIGGEDDTFTAVRNVEQFTEELNRWVPLPPLPTRRRGLAAVALRGKLYALGGGQVSQASTSSSERPAQALPSALSSVDRYDPETSRWDALPPMPTPRMFLAAAVLSGKLYAIGGSDGAQALRTVERFDDDTTSWQSFTLMPARRVFFAAAVLRS